MLTKLQSEIVAEALLSESRAAQRADTERAEARRRDRVSRQSIALFSLTGFVAGAAVGYLFLDSGLAMAFAGLAAGALIGRFRVRRAT